MQPPVFHREVKAKYQCHPAELWYELLYKHVTYTSLAIRGSKTSTEVFANPRRMSIHHSSKVWVKCLSLVGWMHCNEIILIKEHKTVETISVNDLAFIHVMF